VKAKTTPELVTTQYDVSAVFDAPILSTATIRREYFWRVQKAVGGQPFGVAAAPSIPTRIYGVPSNLYRKGDELFVELILTE
jgi:hypothetical protein